MKHHLSRFIRYSGWTYPSVVIFALFLNGCDLTPETETKIKEAPAPSTHFQPISIEGKKFVDGATVFVPVYSHVHAPSSNVALTANLTIHNVSFKHPIIVTSLRFYDHSGKLLKNYLEKSHSLEPMGSAEFIVEPALYRHETALNFIVEWKSESEVSDPVIEAVMANHSGTHSLAFVTTGRNIQDKDSE